jgi:hypothetical protein
MSDTKTACTEGRGDCNGPLAKPGLFVCVDCSIVYEEMVERGEINDFVEEGGEGPQTLEEEWDNKAIERHE